jgi:hypothetical protein
MQYEYRIRRVGQVYYSEYLRPAKKRFFLPDIKEAWVTFDWQYSEELARADIRQHIAERVGLDKAVIIPYK